jgi:hypothetical protein
MQKSLLLLVTILVLATACKPKKKAEPAVAETPTQPEVSLKIQGNTVKSVNGREYRYEVLDIGKGKFAYRIYMNNQFIIHQNVLPGITPPVFFTTTEQADTVAKAALKKLAEGSKIPPQFTNKEFKELGFKLPE